MRIGFAVKVLGEGGLREADLRRPAGSPHLRVSLGYLDVIFDYLARSGLSMYRISSELAPYLTHPEMPQFHGQLDECRDEIEALGEKARRLDLRLSFHPSQYVVLNALEARVAEAAVRDFEWQATLLNWMQLPDEAVVVTHVGGAYGDKPAAIARFAERYLRLPPASRRRLVVENDDTTFSVPDILALHEQCGVRLVFDNLHHFCNNPAGMGAREAMAACLATWPVEQRPKIHFSSPRTEARTEAPRARKPAGSMQERVVPPDNRYHSDYVNAPEFVMLMGLAEGLRPFDVMVESKAKDLAVLKLKADLRKHAPWLAEKFSE